MSTELNEFKEFLYWFGKNESISLEVRQFVLGDVVKNKHITDQSLTLMNQELNRLYNRTVSNLNFLEAQNAQLLAEIMSEKQVEKSTKEAFVKAGIESINSLSENYVGRVKEHNQDQLQQAEASQGESDANQVAALKASVTA